jgi:hypothetical protein
VKYEEKCMKNHTNEKDTERLSEKVNLLTEENQRRFLDVLEVLDFAQSAPKQADTEIIIVNHRGPGSPCF